MRYGIDENKKKERMGQTNCNKQGYLMTVVEYRKGKDITVEFNDKFKTRLNTTWQYFKNGYGV